MNPFERKIVHDAVSEIDGVESSSRGEEPDRVGRDPPSVARSGCFT